MLENLLKDLKISRPGLWFPTVWIYLIPFKIDDRFWLNPIFGVGLFFVTFPLNYLVYGMNDINDINADKYNLRKGNYLFGAKESKTYLDQVSHRIVAIILPFIILFTYWGGFKVFILLMLMILFNIVYNYAPFRLKERPPFEILIQVGYVLTAVFSIWINETEMVPWQTLIYLATFAFHAHLAGEIMDIEPDLLSNKKTTATLIGRKNAKLLMLLLLSLEVLMLCFWFKDFVLSGLLLMFSCWLLIDIFIIFKEKPYTLVQMKWFGIAINAAALVSMIYVLYTGKLLITN